MKQVVLNLVGIVVFSQLPGLAQPYPDAPVKVNFDPPGQKVMTDTQKACGAFLGTETCGIPVCRPGDPSAKTGAGATHCEPANLMSNVITYHNDTVTMRDSSQELQLRSMLLSSTSNTPHFQQHTHGTEHVLYVATQNSGLQDLTRYKILPGDSLEVYLGKVNAYMPDANIIQGPNHGGPQPSMKMHLGIAALIDPGCIHPKDTVLQWWFMDSSGLQWQPQTASFDPDAPTDPNLKIQSYLTSQILYLRRIVIRQANNAVRYFIPLESGCSAIKLCTHNSTNGCDSTQLCRLEAAQLLNNVNCRACAVRKPDTATSTQQQER